MNTENMTKSKDTESVQYKPLIFFETFTLISLGFTATALVAIYFQEDLFIIFSPFIAPFILLFMFLGYLVLTIASVLYIPFQFRKVFWRVFVPITINTITYCMVYYLYDDISDLRIVTRFLLNEKRYSQAADWLTESIQNGDINLEDNWGSVKLPKEYRGLAEDAKVRIKYEYGTYIIWFYRGGGMFEYAPSYIYRSDNIAPPFEDFADVVCFRRLRPYWYDCH